MLADVAATWEAAFTTADAEQLQAARVERHIDHVPSFDRPLFLSTRDWDVLEAAHMGVTSALVKVLKAWAGGAFADLVPLSPALRSLVSMDTHVDPQGFWRYDIAYGDGQLQFLECNAGDPSGLGWVDDMREAFLSLSAMRACQERYSIRIPYLLETHRQMLAERAPGERQVVFHCASDSFVLTDHQGMARHYRAAGWQAEVGDPRDFRWDGRRLWLHDTEVRTICRDNLDEFTLPPWKHDAVVAAYRAGAVRLVNPFFSVVGDYKALFEVLTDPRYLDLFDTTERIMLERYVPWTRLLRAEHVSELLPRQQSLVLKPNYGYGGHGITIGPLVAPSQWAEALAGAAREPGEWVVQRYAPLPAAFGRRSTLSGWMHGGRFVGGLARASRQAIVNVHQGGGLVPIAFVQQP